MPFLSGRPRCFDCDFEATELKEVLAHRREVHGRGRNPEQCTHCAYKSCSKKVMLEHMSSRHGIPSTDENSNLVRKVVLSSEASPGTSASAHPPVGRGRGRGLRRSYDRLASIPDRHRSRSPVRPGSTTPSSGKATSTGSLGGTPDIEVDPFNPPGIIVESSLSSSPATVAPRIPQGRFSDSEGDDEMCVAAFSQKLEHPNGLIERTAAKFYVPRKDIRSWRPDSVELYSKGCFSSVTLNMLRRKATSPTRDIKESAGTKRARRATSCPL
jgi:hypothetical protein